MNTLPVNNIDDAKFSGLWTSARIIDEMSEVINLKRLNPFYGLSVTTYKYDASNPRSIKFHRLISVLKNYGKSLYINDNRYFDYNRELFYDFVGIAHSEAKLTEINGILKEITSLENAEVMSGLIRSAVLNEDVKILADIFTMSFYLYLCFKKISNPFEGLIESSLEIYYTLQFVQHSSYKATSEIQNKLRDLLILLMGDDYDNPISEKELIAEFNYPRISDEDLDKLMMEYRC